MTVYATYDEAANAAVGLYLRDVITGVRVDSAVRDAIDAHNMAEAQRLAYETLASEGWECITPTAGGYTVDGME